MVFGARKAEYPAHTEPAHISCDVPSPRDNLDGILERDTGQNTGYMIEVLRTPMTIGTTLRDVLVGPCGAAPGTVRRTLRSPSRTRTRSSPDTGRKSSDSGWWPDSSPDVSASFGLSPGPLQHPATRIFPSSQFHRRTSCRALQVKSILLFCANEQGNGLHLPLHDTAP